MGRGGGAKVGKNVPGHLTKMVTMPISMNNFQQSSSEYLLTWHEASMTGALQNGYEMMIQC